MYQLTIKPRAIEMAKDAYEWLGDLFLRYAGFRCVDITL